MSTQETRTYVKQHPIKVGLFVVLGVIALGSLSAFSLGYGSPEAANAQVTTAVTPVTVTAAAQVTSSTATAATTVVNAVTTTVTSVVNSVVQTTQHSNSRNQGNTTGATDESGATEVDGVTVTAQPHDATGQGAITDGTGTTVVDSVVITGPVQSDENPSTEPCCSLPETSPTEVSPVEILAPVQSSDNPFTLPCCTVPTVSVTTPITPVITPPTVVFPFDICINIPGVQTEVPPGMDRDDSARCVTVTVLPACTLVASPTVIQRGSASILTWTTQNATSFALDQGIGAVTPTTGGTRSVSPTQTTTYTGTATDASGGVVHCTATVTVTQVTPPPACTLVANPVAVQLGGSSTLTWTTQNATTFTLDQGIGAQASVQGGTHLVTPTQTTTYTGTATGPGGTVHCSATVTVTTNPPPPAPLCTLVANPSAIQSGGSTTLTWTTQNATSFTLDQGIGAVTPTTGGARSVSPTQTTTYTGTATGPGGVVTCATTVTVTNTPPAPQCTLTASPTSITKGGTSTITWGGTNIASVIIDQGIGAQGATGSVNVSPTDTTTYTGTFTTTTGQTLSCAATVTVTNDDGVCTSNCGGGGGGGGGRKNPRVVLSSLKTPDDQPLAFVYLSEIPYTGLDLGPIGTSLYWAMLALWSFAAAYLIFFNVMPFAYRRIGAFGRNVKEVMNQPVAPEPVQGHTAHVAPSAHAAPVASHGAHDTHATHHAAPVAKAPVVEHDGFRAYASGEALTIDDIVKGLAREAAANPSASAHDLSPAFMARAEEPVYTPVAAAPAPVVEAAMPSPRPMAHAEHTPFSDDVRVFIEALLRGDRDAVFGTIRNITRNGGDSEAFLTHAVCALDDAYRSRVDGSTCHPEILAATADCHPSFLERVVTSLTTAVDGSYSMGITGVKLALTRALAVVNG